MPVGLGRDLERTIANAVAPVFPHEGHHFVYDRWREIMGVIVAESRGNPAPEDDAAAARSSTLEPEPTAEKG